MKLILWILLILAWVGILRYRYEIHNFTGNWGWAEAYVWGTVNAISFIGMILILVGTAYPLGAFEGFFDDKKLTPVIGTQK